MILFKRQQLTEEFFIQLTNDKGKEGSDIYLRQTVTKIEYFDKEVKVNPAQWYLIKNQKKTSVSDKKQNELETNYNIEINKSLDEINKKEGEWRIKD